MRSGACVRLMAVEVTSSDDMWAGAEGSRQASRTFRFPAYRLLHGATGRVCAVFQLHRTARVRRGCGRCGDACGTGCVEVAGGPLLAVVAVSALLVLRLTEVLAE